MLGFDLFDDEVLAEYEGPAPSHSTTWCWGATIAGTDGSTCTPGFVGGACAFRRQPRTLLQNSVNRARFFTPRFLSLTGRGHFKNKFCASCRERGIDVPATRVRALTEDLMVHYTSNSLSAGFWKVAPQSLGGGEFRLLNNTVTCESPWLVVYREAPPDHVAWGIMPSQWQKNGAVHMMVAKGTLVPDATLTHSAARRLGSSILPAAAAAAASSDQHEPKRKRRSIVSATAVDVPILFAEESSGASGRSGGASTDLEDLCAACANTSTVPIPEAWYYRSSSLSSSAPSNPASHQGTSTHSTPQDCVTPREDSFDARSSDSYPTTPHGEEPGSLTPRCASTSPVHEDLVQQIMLGEQASSATSAATPRSVLLANLHAAALGARDASLALLAHDATLDEAESARLDGPRIETMARRYALDAQQVEVWMDEAALMGGGGTAAGACAPFIRPLGRGQSAPPQVVDKTCDNEAAAALLLNQQASTQSHGLFRSRDKEPSPRAGSAL